MPYDFSYPTWDQVGQLQLQVDELHRENAVKLKSILDLEDTLYATRVIDLQDKSPCWCCLPSATGGFKGHDETCTKARQATEHLWKGTSNEPTSDTESNTAEAG